MEAKKFTVSSTGPTITAFLDSIRSKAGFQWNFTVAEGEVLHEGFEAPDLVVRFHGQDVDLLLSNKAELLLALELLTMEKLKMRPEEHSLLQFDANDYRALRIEELRLSALTAAEKVIRTKTPFEFSPMNSRERRIIHIALRNEPNVRSESTGLGPMRKVIIYPAGMPSSPPSSSAPPPSRRRR